MSLHMPTEQTQDFQSKYYPDDPPWEKKLLQLPGTCLLYMVMMTGTIFQRSLKKAA